MQRPRSSLIVSDVTADGTIVETIHAKESAETALLIAREGGIQRVPEWHDGSAMRRPVRPSNNLLKHNALLFASEAADYGTTSRLLSEVRTYIGRYVALSDEAIAITCAYVLLTWVYDAFNELPYLRFKGDYGTGKSRALMVAGSLCYKAFFASGASTVSPIFHTLDTFGSTLIFDEADFRFSDEKAELVKIFNNGNARGFPVLRTHVTPKQEFDPRAFSVFGPKIVGMRHPFHDRALESRFLTIEMEPGRATGIPLNLPDAQKDEALALRNRLLSYRIRNRRSVSLDPSLADKAFEPRLNQILLPLLSVVEDGELRDAIKAKAGGLQATVIAERSASVEGQILSAVIPLLRGHCDNRLPLADITHLLIEKHSSEFDRPITNRFVGATLRRLGILLYKSNGIFVVAPGQQERVDALRARYGIEASE